MNLEFVHNTKIVTNIDFPSFISINDLPAVIVHERQLKSLNPNQAFLITPYSTTRDDLLGELR